ncbi:MAG TPA: hypothetical protein VJT80_20665 [Steroidobacteraceae bacterium]|nr:hypothetical protein [Steroidobacteraceae bacterium]
MTPNTLVLSYVSLAASVALAAAAPVANAGNAATHTAAAAKSRICLVLPRAQLGQGSSGADVGEPVRQTLIAYLNGPTVELISLAARIPVQVDAEAQQSACEYVLYTSVVQKKGGGGFGKLLAAAAPIAGMMVPGVGGMTGSYGAIMAGQAVASAASAVAAQSAQQEAMEAITGASEQNIKKGDQITLEYQLMKMGVAEPFATKAESAKASQKGEDLLSPLIEQTAIEVMGAIRNLTAAE